MIRLRFGFAVLAVSLLPCLAAAQGANIALGNMVADSSLPVQVTADQLAVDQANGNATFTGNVLVIQGDMRLQADSVAVEYAVKDGQPENRISRMQADGNVLLVTGAEAAEGQQAIYDIDASSLLMTGNVLLTQGANALSGESLRIDLKTGAGVMEGRVKTTFKQGGEDK